MHLAIPSADASPLSAKTSVGSGANLLGGAAGAAGAKSKFAQVMDENPFLQHNPKPAYFAAHGTNLPSNGVNLPGNGTHLQPHALASARDLALQLLEEDTAPGTTVPETDGSNVIALEAAFLPQRGGDGGARSGGHPAPGSAHWDGAKGFMQSLPTASSAPAGLPTSADSVAASLTAESAVKADQAHLPGSATNPSRPLENWAAMASSAAMTQREQSAPQAAALPPSDILSSHKAKAKLANPATLQSSELLQLAPENMQPALQPSTARAGPLAPASIAASPDTALRDAQPLERLVESISQMRESAQTGRGEVNLRHSEFGMVSMRVSASEGEVQARLLSRDPGFVAAAQNALSERVIAPSNESANTQSQSRSSDDSAASQQHARQFGGSLGSDQQHSAMDRNNAKGDPREVLTANQPEPEGASHASHKAHAAQDGDLFA